MAKRDRKAPKNDSESTTDDDTGIDVDVIEADEMKPSGKRRARERRSASGDSKPTGKAGVVDVAAEEGTGMDSRNPLVKIWTFLTQVVAELKKVIWPTKHEMIVYSIGVLIFVALVTAVIFGLDVGFAKLTLLVFG